MLVLIGVPETTHANLLTFPLMYILIVRDEAKNDESLKIFDFYLIYDVIGDLEVCIYSLPSTGIQEHNNGRSQNDKNNKQTRYTYRAH